MTVPIGMPFRLRIVVGPRNCALDGSPDPPWEGVFSAGGGPLHSQHGSAELL